jgi:hypothetical protein
MPAGVLGKLMEIDFQIRVPNIAQIRAAAVGWIVRREAMSLLEFVRHAIAVGIKIFRSPLHRYIVDAGDFAVCVNRWGRQFGE